MLGEPEVPPDLAADMQLEVPSDLMADMAPADQLVAPEPTLPEPALPPEIPLDVPMAVAAPPPGEVPMAIEQPPAAPPPGEEAPRGVAGGLLATLQNALEPSTETRDGTVWIGAALGKYDREFVDEEGRELIAHDGGFVRGRRVFVEPERWDAYYRRVANAGAGSSTRPCTSAGEATTAS